MRSINVKDSRLWDVAWQKLNVVEKYEALRETILEITTDLREISKEIDYDEVKSELKNDLELLEQRINIRIEDLAKRAKIE